jgi:hypothetical protein
LPALAPWLDDDLQKFYLSLLRSEARHYQDYLDLAQKIAGEDISERVRQLGEAEAALTLRTGGGVPRRQRRTDGRRKCLSRRRVRRPNPGPANRCALSGVLEGRACRPGKTGNRG